jgi:hypothetical protein
VAVRNLRQMISEEPAGHTTIIIPVKLIKRNSVKRLNAPPSQ